MSTFDLSFILKILVKTKNFIGNRECKDEEDYSLLPKNSESNKKRQINTYLQSGVINAKGATGTQRKEKLKIQAGLVL